MVDREKQSFWNMMNVCMELYRLPALSKEAVAIWWNKLERFEFEVVSKSFDKWVDENKRSPTPADIIDIARGYESKKTYVALGRKFSPEEKARNHQRLQEVLGKLNIKRIAS